MDPVNSSKGMLVIRYNDVYGTMALLLYGACEIRRAMTCVSGRDEAEI